MAQRHVLKSQLALSNDARTRLSRAIAECMIDTLNLTGSETLLDYGTGTIALRLQPLVQQVIAADSSRGMLEVLDGKIKLASLNSIRTLLLDLEHSGAEADIQSNIIVSAMTLHHIADTARFASALYGLLAENGQLAIADLDTEAGEFHPDNTGVEHFGFDRAALSRVFSDTGFQSVHAATACEITRPTQTGEEKTYSIFLLSARKPS